MSDKYVPPSHHYPTNFIEHPNRPREKLIMELIRNPNNLVDPAHNNGKDYVLLVLAELAATSAGKVYRAIPELPIEHAVGPKKIANYSNFPMMFNSRVVYKVPKSVLVRYDSIQSSLYGYYFTFTSQSSEHEYTSCLSNVKKEVDGETATA
jgi:hypothetical protein